MKQPFGRLGANAMGNKSTRDQIVEAADLLFYQQGFEHTSFSDIAGTVKISRGNFYYHFKTKDQILDAVIDARLSKTERMLDGWEAAGDTAADRIRSFIDMLVVNKADIMRYGCPVGTMTTELSKLAHPSQPGACRVFTLFRIWLRRQFETLGRADDADALAMHVLALSQGVAALSTAFGDDDFVRREVQKMHDWLTSEIDGTDNPLPSPTHH